MQEGQKTSRTAASNRLWLIISLVIAVTVIAVLLVPEAGNQVEDIPPPVASPAPAPATGGEVVEKQASVSVGKAEADRDVSAPRNDGDVARKYLADAAGKEAAPDAVFAQAQEFQSRGWLADAWLLYFKAAKDGHAGAAMVLAEQADPRFFRADETVLSRPDVVQAHKWYQQAQSNGSDLAGQRLQQLLADLKKSAQEGDEQAAVLLEKWK